MARRHAVLIKLREDVTKREVKELVELLKYIGDPAWTAELRKTGDPKKLVKTYDDEHGDPVFYIP